jgi:hypothetical protein
MANVSATNLTSLYSSVNGVSPVSSGYGNANVVGLLSVGTDGANTVGNISATGNITTGGILTDGYYYANGQPFSGGGGGTYGDSNVVTLMAAFGSNTVSTTGNITGGFFLGNGSQLTGLPATYGNANVSTLLAGFGSNAISTTGNVTAGFFVGNGSLLTNINAGNIVGSYGNANVAAFLGAYGSNTISSTGSVTAGSVSATGNVTSGNINTAGAVSATGNLRGANISLASRIIGDNSTVLSFLAGTNTLSINGGGPGGAVEQSIVSLGTLSTIGNINTANVNASGAVSATGNITGSFFLGNGSQLTGLPATYGNANVAANLAAFGSNPISTTGNITAGSFFGDGGGLSNITVSTGTNISIAGNIIAGGFANVAGNSVVRQSMSIGYGSDPWPPFAGLANGLAVLGNISAGNVSGTTIAGILGEFNTISAAGNILAPGSLILAGTANLATTVRSGGTITAVGNITGGNVTAGGNVTGDFFIGNGSALTGITISTLPSLSVTGNLTVNPGNVNIPSGNINALQGNITTLTVGGITSTGFIYSSGAGLISTGGNVLGGNLNTGGQVSATGNITGGNLRTAGQISATGNATAGNILTAGAVSATGNITGGNAALGTGKLTFGVVELFNNSNRLYTPGTIEVAQVDVNGTTIQLLGNGQMRGTAVSVTGNIAGDYFIGNGSQLTGLTSVSNSATALINSTNTANVTVDSVGNVLFPTTALNQVGWFFPEDTVLQITGANTEAAVGLASYSANSIITVDDTFGVYMATDFDPVTFASTSGLSLVPAGQGGGASLGGTDVSINGTGNVTINSTDTIISATGNITAAGNITVNAGQDIFATSSTLNIGAIVANNAANVSDLIIRAGGVTSPSGVNIVFNPGSGGNILGNIGTTTITNINSGGQTVTGTLSATGRVIALNYTETQSNVGNISGTFTPNIANGSIQYATLTGNITANSITSINNGQSMFLVLTQDATGGRLLNSSWKFAGNVRSLSTAGNATDVISVVYADGTYYASLTTGYA